MLIKNGLVFRNGSFEKIDILTDTERITGFLPCETVTVYEGDVVDAQGCYVIPGLTDVHFHGCMGYDFCAGTEEALDKIAAYEYSQGVTTICPATMSLPESKLSHILKKAREWKEKGDGRSGYAELVGIHLEGPFLNPDRCGAQNLRFLENPSEEMLKRLQEDAGGLIRIVTLAPELEGSVKMINELNKEFHFSIGHSLCDYHKARKAFDAGADHVTHMFNAMPEFAHRATGIIGAAFDEGKCFVELICDGIHVDASMVRAAFRLFGDDRVVMISDSMEAAGMPDGIYNLGDQKVFVNEKMAKMENGTIAGSTYTLYDCLKSAVNMGIPLSSAVKAATINPCRSIGIDNDYGEIEIGKKADFLLLSKDNLEIRKVICL